MDAQIYQFKQRHPANPLDDAFIASASFFAWYAQAMLSFHAAMIRSAVDAARGMTK